MAKINPVQTPTSTSALVTGAIKSVIDTDGTMDSTEFMASQPGGAVFYDFYDNTTHTWLHTTSVDLTNNQDVIQGVAQVSNGTYGYGNVYHGGYDFQWTFDDSGGVQNGWAGLSLPAPVGWTAVPGSAPSEIVGPGYIPLTGSYSGGNYVDTMASPGPIDVIHPVQTVLAAQLGPASDILSFSLAAQAVAGYSTDPNASFDALFNGVVVSHITLADFETVPGDLSTVQWNMVKEFQVNVTAADNGTGTGTLEFHDTTATPGLVGFVWDGGHFHSSIA